MSKYAPSSSALQSKFGFQDDDLKSANHDEIILWLDENASKIVGNIIGYSNAPWEDKIIQIRSTEAENRTHEYYKRAKAELERVETKISEMSSSDTYFIDRYENQAEGLRKYIQECLCWTLGECPQKEITIKSTWEYPIKNGNFMIGFVDMIIEYSATLELMVSYSDSREPLPRLPRWYNGKSSGTMAFEVKSVMPSLGELVRQVRMYESFLHKIPFYIVSPDDRFASALKGQNIGFIKYDP